MSTLTSSHPRTLPPNTVARLLHEVGGELAQMASRRLPGLDRRFACEVVVVADASKLVGELGSYTVNGCTLSGRSYDKLTVSVAHPVHADVDPSFYGIKILTTLAHELAHAATLPSGRTAPAGIADGGHGEDFATAAEHLGLRVSRCPDHHGQVTTSTLTSEMQYRYQSQIQRLAQVNFAGVQGIGLAGPDGMEGTLHSNVNTKSHFHSVLGH